MRSDLLLKRFFAFALIVTCFGGAGCPPVDDNGGGGGGGDSGSGVGAAFSENASAVAAATATVERMAGQGSSLASIQSALLTQLQADSQVAGAAVDPANGVVYADFINGETQAWMVIDATTDPDATLPTDASASTSSASARASLAAMVDRATGGGARPGGDKTVVSQQLNPGQSFWNLPGNNKALVANGLTFFHADWPLSDSTALVKEMLEARGYQVTAEPLAIKHFKELTKYGVILLEAHGLWRSPDLWLELINRHAITGEPQTANCGGTGSLLSLLTTTEATAANRVTYKEDIRCGRLIERNVTRDWDKDGTTTTKQFYQVTANYVSQYAQGKFPDNTLMVMNACRAYRDDLLCPFQEVLAAKCDRGSYFLGWTYGLRYFYGARGVLNLFQLMTASNKELIVNGVTVLSKTTPPRCALWAGLNSGAYKQIDDQAYTIARGGANLLRTGQDKFIAETILAPAPLWWVGRPGWTSSGVANKAGLSMLSDSTPAVTVGGSSVSVSPSSLCCSADWTVSGSDAVYGDLVVSQDGRSSIGVPLHRWKPQIKLQGTNGGMSYTAIFTLQARASVGSTSLRTSAWSNPPAAQFDQTGWDPQGSAFSWKVSGEETIDKKHYKYEGTGQRSFGNDEGGWIESNLAGTSVSLEAYGTATYTTTITDLSDGSKQTVTTDQVVTISRSGTSLSSTWTVAAESFSDDGGFGGTGAVTWSAFAAQPPFAPSTEPR